MYMHSSDLPFLKEGIKRGWKYDAWAGLLKKGGTGTFPI